MVVSSDRRRLYAVNEIRDYKNAKDGAVSSFALDAGSGRLTLKNVVSSGGAGPAQISLDRTGKVAFVADGFGGSLSSYRVLPDGSLSEPVSNFHFPGHGPNPERQSTAYTHCATPSPDNRYVIVNDLGLDRITAFRFDPKTAVITPNDSVFYHADPGSGPRSFTFHPNGRWAYSINEIASTVDALSWDGKAGLLTRFQNLSTTALEFKGRNLPATVHVDRTGKFLYLSNRGADTIGAYKIDPSHGSLTPVQQVSCGGRSPRHFALDPSERWLVVANQANVAVLERNARSGLLSQTPKPYELENAMFAIFV